jgi:multidrug resistance protein MdtO
VADGCADARRAVAERRWPEPSAAAPPSASTPPPLADMERTLEQLSVVSRIEPPKPTTKEQGPHLLLPDATTNLEYVQFAVKGALAALICYVLFIGFDYPGIYTSVVTCFVVSLSTIGSSNQKGLLRFGGAALGGVMGVYALVYAFPNVDRLGGFWLVFATGTAVAAWINFGSPRISYGGYQTGLAFYKATLQDLGPAVSATVVRDRLIGVAFGLIVFGIVEHLLWPVRAADRMHARLADVFRSLAAFTRVVSQSPSDVDSRRQLISQQVADVQGFIESSKFEPAAGGADAQTVERLTADAQTVFVVLLAIAREAGAARPPEAVPAATSHVEENVAAILEGVADRVRIDAVAPTIDLDRSLGDLDRSLAAAQADASSTYAGALALYRELVVAVNRVAAGDRRAVTVVALSSVA